MSTACKATQAEHANILIWEYDCDTKSWLRVASLDCGHTLTVIQMAFSPDDKYLLSVSRDRTLCVWDMSDFSIYFKTDKKTSVHQRIIWACDWSLDSTYFVTVGRDKKCVLWSLGDKKPVCMQPLVLPNAGTAVAFMPLFKEDNIPIVIGMDNGQIVLVYFCPLQGKWSELYGVRQGHHRTVKRLRFQPQPQFGNETLLATCGTDHLVQLLRIKL